MYVHATSRCPVGLILLWWGSWTNNVQLIDDANDSQIATALSTDDSETQWRQAWRLQLNYEGDGGNDFDVFFIVCLKSDLGVLLINVASLWLDEFF